MTQEQLALEVGINKSEISRLEKGKRNPKWETMKRLAAGLGVPCWHMVAVAEGLDLERERRIKRASAPGRPGT
jgi:transcriptional regulator with XRE-family HTH domain